MLANHKIDPNLLDNKEEFADSFFSRFTLRNDDQPLKLNETISKDYLFPTFYRDVSCAIGIFLCDYDKAQEMMPHAKMKPVKMPRNKALVTFSCYEYKGVLGVAPYNEIAMTIPCQIDPSINVPVLPILAEKMFSKFGYHVFHMPVTSLENQIRGQKIWGLPKVVDDIKINVEGNVSTTVATDADGNDYFSLKVPIDGTPTSFDVRSNLYSVKENELKQSETCFKATFNVTKNMSRLVKGGGENPQVLVLGKGKYADKLRALDIEPQPFQFRYASTMNACFDLPNKNYISPIKFD